MIETGQTLPPFELPDETGTPRSFDDLKDENGLVLYVYPKDDTPGCTSEAQGFRDHGDELRELGYAVVGVSKDSAESHCRFKEKYDLDFPLLTDADGSYLERIGAWGEKKLYGKTHVGIIRSTFVTDADGRLVEVYRNVRAKGHPDRVMRDLRKLAD